MPQTIPDHLAYAAERFPEDLAHVEGERRVTWSELHALAREAAAGLIALGLEKGDRAAICAENSIDWTVVYHAIAQAGAAAALVYFELAPAEIEAHVRRPGCRTVFASQSVLDKVTPPACVEHVVPIGDGVALHDIAASGATGQPDLPSRAPVPDDLAAIIYTSGTTGGAKGVMLSHRNLMANCGAIFAKRSKSHKTTPPCSSCPCTTSAASGPPSPASRSASSTFRTRPSASPRPAKARCSCAATTYSSATGTHRGRPRRHCRTAGCTPATSPVSMPRATSTSRAAASTSSSSTPVRR